ncbi:FmdB family zinc ribbon protein [Pigmentiphaga sp.]|uniref:FmdB family zinc ribbon protein n=1 Tax=Pigmentiphaga sp. TaxID=1977564 RepID=UPI00128D8903|nr:FmdB family zinc ribbon protein [Pigmentiphaga sp.]MPS29817.1 zinc ribbon domain-containing protein [Alcaligenaceae bacterium SAGV5]MPS51524.1 zinc ribbon domain-containing protein [Alcaligenaceae bacterium SAGV3]MPT55551.1 zinc ribbon domain-containing protein [Alcaligenaceae bacterium]
MPIYAYKCSACGHQQDVLQKLSDAPLTDCPACGQAAFSKQLTAAGFQLKGSGWYVTDFRNNSGGKSAGSTASSSDSSTEGASAAASSPPAAQASSGSDSGAAASPAAPATSTPAST